MNKHLKDKGFTLVELLIVVVVLGILAGIVVFAVGGARTTAEDKSCEALLKTVAVAAEAHKADTGGYPTTLQQLKDGSYIQVVPDRLTEPYIAVGGATNIIQAAINGDSRACKKV
jgi:prepilin-type N-terminal cleavage/methylation domain-containing protein